jgi:hypothetical protein
MLGVRYHVASLAAVFLALAVGILLGVAISGKLSDAEESLQQEKIRDLEQDLRNEQSSADSAEERGAAAERLVEDAYPVLMEQRLEDRRVAVIFLGPVDRSILSAVERTLTDADGGRPARTIGLEVPVDPVDLQDTLAGDEQLAAYASEDGDFGDLGRELGRELVVGGDTVLWNALQSTLVEERSGALSEEVDAVVVRHSWTPPDPQGDSDAGEEAARVRSTSSLLDGIVGGLDSFGIPVVGVAGSDDPQDLLELYRDEGVSSVDDVDTVAGRLALAVLLAGGEPGHYGLKDTATDGVVPPIEPVPQLGG